MCPEGSEHAKRRRVALAVFVIERMRLVEVGVGVLRYSHGPSYKKRVHFLLAGQVSSEMGVGCCVCSASFCQPYF